jgi:hypothetical protein
MKRTTIKTGIVALPAQASKSTAVQTRPFRRTKLFIILFRYSGFSRERKLVSARRLGLFPADCRANQKPHRLGWGFLVGLALHLASKWRGEAASGAAFLRNKEVQVNVLNIELVSDWRLWGGQSCTGVVLSPDRAVNLA